MMKKRNMLKILSLLISMTLLFSVIGCSQTPEEPETGADTGTEQEADKEEVADESDDKDYDIDSIGIGTASIGGALYAFGGGFVNVWNSIGINGSAEVTGGSVHNVNLIQAGELDSALISQGAAYQGWEGIGLFEGQEPAKKLRTALPLHPAFIHGWTTDEDVNSYADLADKIICGGPAGGTSDEYSKEILEILNVPAKKFVNAAFADSTNMLRDSLVDVFVSSMGAPGSGAAEAASSLNAKIIGVNFDDADKVIAERPFYTKMELPANTYPNQTEPVETIVDVNAYFFSADVPEDVVYDFVKASYEQIDELILSFAGADAMTYENVQALVLPLHPGAYKYYEEMGVDVPEAAMPID